MPKPHHVDENLYQIMTRCWKSDPDARPTFTELKNQLKDMETLHKRLINMKMYDKQLHANVEDLIASLDIRPQCMISSLFEHFATTSFKN